MRALIHSIASTLPLALIVSGCGKGDPAASGTGTEVEVRTAPVEMLEFRDEVVAQGEWRSSGEVDVISPGAAVVQSVAARVGDLVRAGQTVAWLETRESVAALQGAQLMLQQARDSSSRAEARRALALARRDVVRIPVTAPRGGVVVRRSVEPGSQIGDAGEILAIVPPELIVFEARAPATERGKLRGSQSAIVNAAGFPPIPATVQRILPVADSISQTAIVWIVANRVPLNGLHGSGTATITVGGARHNPAVPDSAVVEDDLTGETRVAIVDAERRAVWTPVLLGARAGTWREVRSPLLQIGSRVITEGQRGLPDSTRVKPAP
jgi:biotin carboxyl carrier protein